MNPNTLETEETVDNDSGKIPSFFNLRGIFKVADKPLPAGMDFKQPSLQERADKKITEALKYPLEIIGGKEHLPTDKINGSKIKLGDLDNAIIIPVTYDCPHSKKAAAIAVTIQKILDNYSQGAPPFRIIVVLNSSDPKRLNDFSTNTLQHMLAGDSAKFPGMSAINEFKRFLTQEFGSGYDTDSFKDRKTGLINLTILGDPDLKVAETLSGRAASMFLLKDGQSFIVTNPIERIDKDHPSVKMTKGNLERYFQSFNFANNSGLKTNLKDSAGISGIFFKKGFEYGCALVKDEENTN